MTLRLKVVVLVTVFFALLGLALYLVFNATVMRGFIELEKQSALHLTSRVEAELQTITQRQIDSLSYLFSSDRQTSLLDLTPDNEAALATLKTLGVAHFLLVDADTSNSYRGIDVQNASELASEIQEQLQKVASQIKQGTRDSGGLLSLGNQPHIIAISQIGGKTSKHFAIASKPLAEDEFAQVRRLLPGSIRIEPIGQLWDDADWGDFFRTHQDALRPLSLATPLRMYGLAVLRDMFQRPLLGLVIGQPRELMAKGIRARNITILLVALFTIGAIATASSFITRGVLNPLRQLREQAKAIADDQPEKMRLELAGDKEFQQVSQQLNQMLSQLSEAKQEEILARQSAELADSVKADTLSHISTELRTALTTILGMHHLLLKRNLEAQEQAILLSSDKAAWELVSAINKLLQITGLMTSASAEYLPIVGASNSAELFRFTRPLRIIFADDTPGNRIILEELLSDSGHFVLSVDDGAALVEAVRRGIEQKEPAYQFDLILTDISMPVLDGIDATREIRSLEQENNIDRAIPIIAITAHAMNADRERIAGAGVDAIITKPIKPQVVAQEFKRLLPALADTQ